MQFRPHHFLCTLGFEGKGYSPEFVANYLELASRLRAPGGDEVHIDVVGRTDSICDPCPNRRGKACESEGKISKLDAAHAKVLGLSPGDSLTWGEAKELIRKRMTLEAFETACAPCAWKSLGLCEKALVGLIENGGPKDGKESRDGKTQSKDHR